MPLKRIAKKFADKLKTGKNDFVFQVFIFKTCSTSAQSQKGINASKMLHHTFQSPNFIELGYT